MSEEVTSAPAPASNGKELIDILQRYQFLSQKLEGAELLQLRRQEVQELLDCCLRQKRTLDFMAGEKVEPMTHFGEAVLLPAGGFGP